MQIGKTLQEQLEEAQKEVGNCKHALSLTVKCPTCSSPRGEECAGVPDLGAIHSERLNEAWASIALLKGSQFGESVEN
jgi:hypothetical protein